MKKLNFIAAFLCIALVVFAQESKLSNHSRAFLDAYKNSPTAEKRAELRKHFALKTAQNEQEIVSAYVHFYNENADKEAILATYGATLNNDFGEFVTATIPANNLEQLSQDEQIKLVEIGTRVERKMDKARPATNVNKAQAGTDLSHPFLGTDVIVGVIDAGFQYNHITFYDANNSEELRVKRVIKQTTNTTYTTQAQIENAQYDDKNDDTGHGTHVAGIAAGAYSGNNYYGVATDADIFLISMGAGNTDITDGIQAIFNYASEVNKPAVVNLSLGWHLGPHDGTSTFDVALDKMVGPGRIVCGAAGNEGNYKLYKEVTLQAGESAIMYTTVSDPEYYYAYNIFMDIWGDNGQEYTVEPVFASGTTIKWTGTALNATTESSKSYSGFTTYASGNLDAYSSKSTDSKNSRGNVTLVLGDDYKQFKTKGSYKFGIKITAKTAGTVRGWIQDQTELFWEGGTNTHTVGEIGGTANRIISVGAWTTRVNNVSHGISTDKIAPFSSLGPTTDGRVKPEISAPGDAIAASVPNTTAITSGQYFEGYYKADEIEKDGTTYYWAYMSGTSMATPFVTGVVATWLQANPNLSPEDIKNIFAETAKTDTYTGACPNNTWGYGKIDAHAGLLKILSTTDIKNLEQLPNAIMLYPNPSDGAFRLFFTNNDTNVSVRIYAMNGQEILSERVGNIEVQETRDFNLGNIETGAYIVKIVGDNTNETCRLLVR